MFLYNRCGEAEIAARIRGVLFSASEDGINWEDVSTELVDEQIHGWQAIPLQPICAPCFIRLRRSGQGEPIHISQVTLTYPREETYQSMIHKNVSALLEFSRKHSLQTNGSGWIYDKKKLQGAALTIRPTWSSCLDIEAGIDNVFISRSSRFSNALMQLANAVLFAHKIGAKDVYIPEGSRIRGIFPKGNRIPCHGLGVSIRIGTPPGCSTTLEGWFFNIRKSQNEFYRDLPSPYEAIQTFSHGSKLHDPMRAFGPKELVIHIRSGDVFNERGAVHPHYGQPPLAFYRLAIRHAKPESVHLIYEDTANPIIHPLKEWLQSQPIKLITRPKSTLRKDVKRILRARTLVAGRGTFVPGVVALGTHLQTIYCFHEPLDLLGMPRIMCHVIRDRSLNYVDAVLGGKWVNSREQRALMTTYADTNLVVDTVAASADMSPQRRQCQPAGSPRQG